MQFKKQIKQNTTFRSLSILLVVFFIFSPLYGVVTIRNSKPEVSVKKKTADASYQFSPISGTLVTGTEQTKTSGAVAAGEGVNLGSWKATKATDNFHWVVAGTASGINAQLAVGGVELNGANTMMVQTTFDLDATVLSTVVQICDWNSSTSVDHAADAQCTGGGWRTLNNRKVAITATTVTNYHWQIYDGYWSNGSNTAISTPLSNFIDGSNNSLVRYYSTTNTSTTIAIDSLKIMAVINPVYTPSGFVEINAANTQSGDYTNTTVVTQGASDGQYLTNTGTAGVISDFYFPFTNVKTYTGMNTILVRAEYGCTTTGINIKPKIYNFNSAAWEDLTSTTIACSATDATNIFAKNNVTIADYISAGEIRVGFYGSAVSATVGLRVDQIYIMVGTTNTSTAADDCFISFGSVSAGDCSNTRTIDTTAATSSWNIATEDESTTFGHDYFPGDNDADAVVEEAAGASIKFSVTKPVNSAVTAEFFAARYASGVSGTTGTSTINLVDFSGFNAASAYGMVAIGASSANSTLVYTDNITTAAVTSGSYPGMNQNPEDYIDANNNQMWMRLRTSVGGATTNNAVRVFDFAFVSIQWIETDIDLSTQYQFMATSNTLVTGTERTITSATTPGTDGVNAGSWKGAITDDNFHWAIDSTASGFNAQLSFAGVELNGANTMMIESELDLDATVPSTVVQICDWNSSTSVDHAADAQCTGGGWRTLNNRDVAITTATASVYHWQIYDGYWSNGSNTAISTPLSNFVDATNGTRIRFYSTTNTASIVAIDYVRVSAVINPVYTPSGFVEINAANTQSGDYTNTTVVTQGASDGQYLTNTGTAGVISDFYFPFTNVKTYTGMNTILVRAEYGCTTTGINIKPKIYNFNSAAWEDLTSTTIACSATDATNIFAKNNVTIADYISAGEIRVGFYGSAVSATVGLRVDQIYIMVGTTNTSTAADDCFISFGSVSAGDCSNTRTIDTTAATSSWNIATEDESTTFGHDYFAFDNDVDVTIEEAAASHVKFSVTKNDATAITAAMFAARIMSGTTGTVISGIADYSGFNVPTNGSFLVVGSGGTTALTYSDPITIGGVASGGPMGTNQNPEDLIDSVNNKAWMRVRTSASGSTASNSVNQIDFLMITYQWIEVAPETSNYSISFSLSDNTVGFGALTSAAARFATADTIGSSSEVEAHTLTAQTDVPDGYTIYVQGETLTSGANTIDAMGGTNAGSSVGTNQFGLRMTATGGTGSVLSPYAASGYAYDATGSAQSPVASVSNGDNVATTYSVRYIGNISDTTPAGEYSTQLTYTITATY
jgi:hypothetical protein